MHRIRLKGKHTTKIVLKVSESVHDEGVKMKHTEEQEGAAFLSVPACGVGVLGLGTMDLSFANVVLFLTYDKGVFFLSFLASGFAPSSKSISAHATDPLSHL